MMAPDTYASMLSRLLMLVGQETGLSWSTVEALAARPGAADAVIDGFIAGVNGYDDLTVQQVAQDLIGCRDHDYPPEEYLRLGTYERQLEQLLMLLRDVSDVLSRDELQALAGEVGASDAVIDGFVEPVQDCEMTTQQMAADALLCLENGWQARELLASRGGC